MKTYKAADLLGTQYIHLALISDLQSLIDKTRLALDGTMPKHMPNQEQTDFITDVYTTKEVPVVDLDGIHLTYSAGSSIVHMNNTSPIKFIDSAIPGRNDVLDFNKELISKTYVNIPLKYPGNIKTVLDKINEYNVTGDQVFTLTDNSEIYFSFVFLLNMSCTNFNFCVSNSFGVEYLIWLHNKLYHKDWEKSTKFFAVFTHEPKNTWYVDIATHDPTSSIVTIREGYTMLYDRAWSVLHMIPEELNKSQPARQYPELLQPIVNQAFQTLTDNEVKTYTLDELIREAQEPYGD